MASLGDTNAEEILKWARGTGWEALQRWFDYVIAGEGAAIKMVDSSHEKERSISVAEFLGASDGYLRQLRDFKVTDPRYPNEEAMEIQYKIGGGGKLYKKI